MPHQKIKDNFHQKAKGKKTSIGNGQGTKRGSKGVKKTRGQGGPRKSIRKYT